MKFYRNSFLFVFLSGVLALFLVSCLPTDPQLLPEKTSLVSETTYEQPYILTEEVDEFIIQQPVRFSVLVFNSATQITSANLEIKNLHGDILYAGLLSPTQNDIEIQDSEANAYYQLKITKDFLVPIVKIYSKSDLLDSKLTFQFINFKAVPQPIYWGLFRETDNGPSVQMDLIADFEQNFSYRPFSVMWYLDWNLAFPAKDCLKVIEYGAIPHLVWEPCEWRIPSRNTLYLQDIIKHKWDPYINQWAKDVAQFKYPVFIRFMHEFNGNWYPWSLDKNGQDPKLYIRAFQYVVNRFRAVGATNAIWIWCPNQESIPNQPWNDFTKAYPGNTYVDWIGIDGYNFGTSQPWSHWVSFEGLFQKSIETISRLYPTKPIMIAEFASAEVGGNKAEWMSEIPLALSKFKNVKALYWFDIKKETDWTIQSSPESKEAFQKILLNSVFH